MKEFTGLKARMELEWNSPGVRCPNHGALWAEDISGSRRKWFWSGGLYYAKGRKKFVSRIVGMQPWLTRQMKWAKFVEAEKETGHEI